MKNSKLIVSIVAAVVILTVGVGGTFYAKSTQSMQSDIKSIAASQKSLTKQVNNLQYRIDEGQDSKKLSEPTRKHNSKNIEISTTVAPLDKAQAVINQNPFAYVDIQLGKGITIFANKNGAGEDVSENTYYDGTYVINGKSYKATNFTTTKHNSSEEWSLLKESKSNQAFIVSENTNDESYDNILHLEQI